MFLQVFLVILHRNLTVVKLSVKKFYLILLCIMLACIGCEWRMQSDLHSESDMIIERYDRLEAFFLTTGDFSALQQMQTRYPMQTRRLIEDVLKLGQVDDAHINVRFLSFFQDSTLQSLIAEVGHQYGNMEDVDKQLSKSFERMTRLLPNVKTPEVYTQIGSLDQSIVVDGRLLGISLDKYLGADYSLYVKYGYSEKQRSMMVREYIVPDCLAFYLLSTFPAPNDSLRFQHMGRIQYTVNRIMDSEVFENARVEDARKYMSNHKGLSFTELLEGK